MSKISNKTSLSIVALHYNTDDILNSFVKNVDFADKIIIIDLTNSIKDTYSNVKIISLNDENIDVLLFKKIDLIENNWMLTIHTTHFIDENLKLELLEKIKSNEEKCYSTTKELKFFNKNIKYGTLGKESILCLIHAKYYQNIFESTRISIPVNKLKNKIINNSYTSFDAYTMGLQMQNKLEVNNLFLKGKKPTYFDFLGKPFFCFVNHYFIKLGFLNGKEGFILVYIHSFNVLRKQLQLWLKYKNLK